VINKPKKPGEEAAQKSLAGSGARSKNPENDTVLSPRKPILDPLKAKNRRKFLKKGS
jgi:hypothetical protein